MIHFFLKSTICIFIFFIFYKLFLEKQKIHQFNRFYLLGMLLMSLIIPNIELSIESPLANIHVIDIAKFDLLSVLFWTYLFYGYVFISSFLFVRLIISLVAVIHKIRINKHIETDKGMSLVLINDTIVPHTFLSYIFLNKKDYSTGSIKEEIYTHEFTHGNEKHTIDVLLIELFQVFFWFNPLIYLVKNSIKLNHEFIADEKVIKTHNNQFEYQNLLLDLASFSKPTYIVSSVNYSLTKQRFKMMEKQSSVLIKKIIQITVLPFVILIIFLLADVSISDEHNSEGDHESHTEHLSEVYR